MRIDAVHAQAFGPLVEQRIDLAPGMTVFHGPNEVGKSSWFAAIQAGLCGVRRVRGPGTKEQRNFRERHKPWSGPGWRVGVEITLDGGERRRLTHDLDSGSSEFVDLGLGRAAADVDIDYDGCADGSRLLGLNRDSARATIFVAQADVLRVLQDAEKLQEFIQRATTSNTFDTTVEEALERIRYAQRTRVGAPHVASRPLRQARDGLEAARARADAARDAHHDFQRRLRALKNADNSLKQLESDLAELRRAEVWLGIDELRKRSERAQVLLSQSRKAPSDEPADDDATVRRVTEALGSFRERGECPVPPIGATVEQLEAQLAQIPGPPTGDQEPHDTVTVAQERLIAARSSLAAHDEGRPEDIAAPLVAASTEELNRMADSLDVDVPTVDAALEAELDERKRRSADSHEAYRRKRAEHEAHEQDYLEAQAQYRQAMAQFETGRTAYEAELKVHTEALDAYERTHLSWSETRAHAGSIRRVGLLLTAVGVALAAVGVAIALLVDRISGGIVASVCLMVAGVGIWRRTVGSRELKRYGVEPRHPGRTAPGKAPSPPAPPSVAAPGAPPTAPSEDSRIGELSAKLAVQRERYSAHAEKQKAINAQLQQLDVPADALTLRQLARAVQSAQESTRTKQAWTIRRQQLERAVVATTGDLLLSLANREDTGGAIPFDEDPAAVALARFAEYWHACKRRLAQRQQSDRRAGLERELAARHQSEDRHARALAAFQGKEEQLAQLAQGLGLTPSTTEPAAQLDAWLLDQTRLRKRDEERRAAARALEELLDHESIEDLESEVRKREASAGARPELDATSVASRIKEATRRHRVQADTVAGLRGEIDSMRAQLPCVAEAIEREADAERELARLARLSSSLELCLLSLERAKERVSANIAPALTARIRPWLRRITGGRYTELTVRTEDLSVEIRTRDGRFREAVAMSHGTMEQVYLLLRLALAEFLATKDETAPVVLDDVTVQSDQERTVAFLELLHELSRERQVVLFTQEQECVEWAEERLVGERDRVFRLQRSW